MPIPIPRAGPKLFVHLEEVRISLSVGGYGLDGENRVGDRERDYYNIWEGG